MSMKPKKTKKNDTGEAAIFNFDQESDGEKARKRLKKLGVKSPEITELIQVKKGLWVVPKTKDLSKKEKTALVEKVKSQETPIIKPSRGGYRKIKK